MKTKKRVGPITADMLPVPKYEGKSDAYFKMYEMGERGGWKKEPIPDTFMDEFYDLMDRYGGIDCDGDSRLRAVLYDRTIENCPFHPVPNTSPDSSTNKEFAQALRIARGNLETASTMLNYILVDFEYRIKGEKE